MNIQNHFKRYELKYLITVSQYKKIAKALREKTVSDEYGKSSVRNIYFDTPDFRLIQKSLEKPIYKEKLRLRSYGVANENDIIFTELKKKYDSVVYKRRENMTYKIAKDFLVGSIKPFSQITNEIAYFMSFYENIAPRVFISYSREAFFGKDDRDLRITFDTDILWRDEDLSLSCEIYGSPVLAQDTVLMEIKTASAIPLWLSEMLTHESVFKTSFSKYGTVYTKMLSLKKGGVFYA